MTTKTYARVIAGVVAELVTLPANLVIGTDIFHADIAPEFIDVTAASPQPAQNWTYVAGLFSPPAAMTRDQMAPILAFYASYSQGVKLKAGVTVNVGTLLAPVMVLSDGENSTRADLALLALFGQINPTGTQTWIDNNGVSTVLTGAQLVTLATAVGTWVSNTYAALAGLLAQISAGAVTTTAQVVTFAWPAS